MCVFVIYFISFVVCLTFRFVAPFVESTSTSIEWPIVQRIPLTPSASDQNNTSQNPNCSRATPGVAAHTSGGGLKSNQASCTYSHYAALGYTTTDQLLPCHFGGADNSQCQRWRKWWPCGGGANVGGSICSSADHYRIKRLSFLRKSTRKNWEKE